MVDLSRKEIVAQLKKLGINSLSEVNYNFSEYKSHYKTSSFHSKTIPFLDNDKEEIKMFDDRRKFIRFSIFLGLKFKLPKGANYFLGVIRDFSRKGFCFVSNNSNFQSKEILSFDVKLPVEDKFVPILGKTVWVKQVNGNCLVGAELIEVDKKPIWKILDYAYKRWADAKGYITNNRK